MYEETFRTKREFNKQYPSKVYICSNCNSLSSDKLNCSVCGWRADGLFGTMGKGLKYTIEETGESEEIFKPIEIYEKERRK